MPFHSPDEDDPERIMSFGGQGSGKTFDLLTIAAFCQATRSDAQFYAVDTDRSMKRMLRGERFGVLTNVHVLPVTDWLSLMATMTALRSKVRPQDWTSIDLLSPTWEWVVTEFTHRVFGKDRSEFFLQARSAMKAGDKKLETFSGWKDYGVINPMYGDLQTLILQWPSHMFCTAEVKALDRTNAEKDTKAMFGPYGVLPVGQKRTPHIFSTVLWKMNLAPGEWSVTTIKDRERVLLEGVVINNFAVDYLKKVAGWVL
jgi:hypothetical protein